MRQFPFAEAVWFHGIVEEINDPDELGRVQVRCFSVHTEIKEKSEYSGIPTEELIWAQVAGSPMDGRMHGLGKSPHKLVRGTQVAGIFMDGARAQMPVVMFVMGLYTPESQPDTSKGFSDPTGEYPFADKLDTPHINQLATSKWSDHPVNELLAENKIDLEPEQDLAPEYPHSQVFETKAGHLLEFDDTPGAERIRVIHKSGSYMEMKADGRVVAKSVNNKYEMVDGDRVEEVTGNKESTVRKDKTTTVEGNQNSTVLLDKTDTVEGNHNSTVSGNKTTTVLGHTHYKAPTIDLGNGDLEPMVLGDKLAQWADALVEWLDTHNHIGNLGIPTSPPISPNQPISAPFVFSGGVVYSTKNRTH